MKWTAFIITLLFLCPMPVTSVASAAEGEIPDLSGTWSGTTVATMNSRIGPIGGFRTTTTSRLILEIEQDGRELEIHVHTCAVEMDSTNPMVSTSLSDGFVENLGVVVRPAVIREIDGEFQFLVQRQYSAQGVRLADLAQDPLPEDRSDPRLIDQDGDGNPGFTVSVGGMVKGEVYVIQRGWDELSGTIEDEDHIEGHIRWDSVQRVIDASRRLLMRQPSLQPNNERARNYFEMTRVEDGTRCSR